MSFAFYLRKFINYNFYLIIKVSEKIFSENRARLWYILINQTLLILSSKLNIISIISHYKQILTKKKKEGKMTQFIKLVGG